MMVESHNKGRMIDLVKEIEKRSGFSIEVSVFPPKRMAQSFSNKKFICAFPGVGDKAFSVPYYESHPFYFKEDYIFSKKEKLVNKVSDLDGKIVGLTEGYPYSSSIKNSLKFRTEYATADELNIKKLVLGRIDYFIVEKFSGIQATINTRSSDKIVFNENLPVGRMRVYFACQKTKAGKKIAQKISKAIKELEKEKTLNQIFFPKKGPKKIGAK